MKKEIILALDEKVYERLLALCNGNEECIKDYAVKALEKQMELEKNAELRGLEDYLKTETPGNRAYGIKGQGW